MTFIEIMTVVLMIAVLIAIGIPSFLGAKGRASDRVAQASLRIAFTNAKAIYAETESFDQVTVAALRSSETVVSFTNGNSTGPKVVSVDSSADGVILAAKSPTGTCYVIGDTGSFPGTVFGSLASPNCDASTVPDLPTEVPTALHVSDGGGWSQAW